jgi:hypothetical protein
MRPESVRRRVLAALLACLALAQAGCGTPAPGAAAYTCGYMRDTAGTFREQARALVDREGLRARRLSHEEAVLDAEFRIRRICDGAPDAEQPYHRAARLSSRGWVSPSAR